MTSRRGGYHEIKLGEAADPAERLNLMAARYFSGETLQEIGQAFGLSRERVRQILSKAGVEIASVRPSRTARPFDATDARWLHPNQRLSWRKHDEHRLMRRALVTLLRTLAGDLDRIPTYQELAGAWFGRPVDIGQACALGAYFAGRAGRGHTATARTAGMHRLYRVAGMPTRAPGRPKRGP